jgi:hypothetical protein
MIGTVIHSLIQSFPHFRRSLSYSRIYLLQTTQYRIITPTDTIVPQAAHSTNCYRKETSPPGQFVVQFNSQFQNYER